MEKQEHISLNVSMRRNHHPYMSSTYINGYIKDQPLKNMSEKEVISSFEKVNKEFGRRAQRHAGNKNLTTETKSIQGEWTNTLWEQFPKHMQQPKIEMPYSVVMPYPDREYLPAKQRPHPRTKVLRKKHALPNIIPNFDYGKKI